MSAEQYRATLHEWARRWVNQNQGYSSREVPADAEILTVVIDYKEGDWRGMSCQEDPRLEILIEWRGVNTGETYTSEAFDTDPNMDESWHPMYTLTRLLLELFAIEEDSGDTVGQNQS